jgi:predicted DNA-binding transcriptional regulator AlpA
MSSETSIQSSSTGLQMDHSLLFKKKIWYIDDVIAFTEYSRGTIYNLVSAKSIPHQRQRKRLIFIPNEILNWMFKGD